MGTSKDIKGQGTIRAFFGINMSKNENPSILDSLNPFDPSDLFDVSRTEYFLGLDFDPFSGRNF
jgi:hypothetical protein